MPDVLHILESDFIAEVIDPQSGQGVAPGQTGELVLTNLGRSGSPVLRYRTSDLVKRTESTVCVCGSHEMALQGGILGRTDDMVTVRGVNLYPAAVEEIVRSCQGVGEYRVVFESAVSWQRSPWKWSLQRIARIPRHSGTAQKDAGSGVYSAYLGFGGTYEPASLRDEGEALGAAESWKNDENFLRSGIGGCVSRATPRS
jgi:acyl-CoA synthetase (AMP-forming)/AMP-acid ligase II